MYQLYRYRAELTFYVSVPSMMNILRSPMASMSVLQVVGKTLDQLFNPLEVYERGINKGEYKLLVDVRNMIPYYRQFYRLENLSNSVSWFQN
jgi:hypothetical protein